MDIEIRDLLIEIANAGDCKVIELNSDFEEINKKNIGLPDDLTYYFQNYSNIVLFESSLYPFKIVGENDFFKANPVIVGEDIENDISNDWYIIAIAPNSQYITIDLSLNKKGYCYDSYWERHGLVGDQPIIALSFTELLHRLYQAKGERLFWLDDDFISYGDAYDE